MDNFARAVRLALHYYWTVIASFCCALIVAVLWSANIGALYPLVEVVGANENLSQRLNHKIDESRREIDSFAAKEARLNEELAHATPGETKSIKRQLSAAAGSRVAAERTLEYFTWLRPWVDTYLPEDPFKTLAVIVAVLLVATIVKDAFMTLGSVLADRLAHLATFDLRKEFYRRTLRMDVATFNEGGTSDLLARFTYDVDGVAGGIQTLFGKAVREPLKMITCIIGAAYICWQLLLMSMILAPAAGFLIALLAKTLKRANRKALEEMSSLYGILAESFGGIKVVKAFTMERAERHRFHETSKKCYRKAMRIAVVDGLINPVTETMGITTICLAILFGAYLVMTQERYLFGIKMCSEPLSLSALMAFYGMLAGISDPARRLTEVFNRLQRAAASADRVYQSFDREPRVCNPPQPVSLPRHHRDLEFDHVSFGYNSEQLVLEDINLRIPFGETLALVGHNGSGKTTLANLICRFFDPVSGTVRLDGIDLRNVRLRELRRQIGIVTQETLLFDDTVFNNIRYGSPHAPDEAVIEAAKQAHAHKFIEQRLERGYQTMVGPGGGRLSGGQRQRIALARAILRDPAILILDEATSQIDLESEQLIHKVLEQLTKGRTTVIVTHRLSTLDLADRIAVMESGRIVDLGTHDQLMSRCELYRRLHQIQLRETA